MDARCTMTDPTLNAIRVRGCVGCCWMHRDYPTVQCICYCHNKVRNKLESKRDAVADAVKLDTEEGE